MPTPIVDALKDDSDLTMHTHTEADLGATLDSRYLNTTSDLSDVSNVATARTNLGLVAGGTGDIWVEKAGDTITGNLILNDNVSVFLGTGSDGELFHDGSNTYFQNNTGNIIIENDASNGDITFKVNDGGVDTTVMTLDGATGYVGIGTTSPVAKLQVNGDASAITSIFKANATTPGNITEWQNSSGGVLSSVDKDGKGTFAVLVSPTWRPASDSMTALQMQNASGSPVVTLDTQNKYMIIPKNGSLIIGDYPTQPFVYFTCYNSEAAFGVAGVPLTLTAGWNSTITLSNGAVGYESGKVYLPWGNLAIGTDSPSARIHAVKTTEQLRLGYDASNYFSTTVSATGATTFDLVAGSGTPIFTFSDQVLVADKVIFTQTDGNEYIDSLADGYMDYRATTAHRFGDGTNQLVIDADGDLSLEGTAKYERHVQIPAMIDGKVANQPTSEDFFTAGGLQFASAGAQYAYCQWEIPDDWDGTDIVFEVDWFPDSGAISGTDTIKWDVEYRAIAEGEAINNGTSVTVSVTDSTDYARYITKHSRFTLTFNNANQPLTTQDHVYFKISRDTGVANDFAGTVTVAAYEIIYQSKGLPSSN